MVEKSIVEGCYKVMGYLVVLILVVYGWLYVVLYVLVFLVVYLEV